MDWAELAELSGNLFATPEWLGIWWRHFGNDRELLISRQHGCIVPLYVWRAFPFRVLRFIGHGPSDVLGPVCAPDDWPEAAAHLRDLLAGERYDLFLGEQLPAEGGLAEALGARVLRRTASPTLRFDGSSWEEFLAERSSNFREQVRRKERKLEREHAMSYRLADDPERLPADLDALFALHRARWPRDTSHFGGSPQVEAFHRELATTALSRRWLRLWLLEASGRPVAAWYGFRYAGAEYYYQAGRDPSFDAYSVGTVLLAHTIRSALETGATEYRFLRGGEAYKYRFASEDAGVETIALTRGLLARAALGAADRWRRRAPASEARS